jgi:hypothetical protein
MAYTKHRGKRVSPAHKTMLAAYEHQYGRAVHINQGARTLREQAAFYAHYLRYGRPLAARPWGGAPHIKWGKQHHALDINAPEPAHSVAAFYRAHGVPVAFNVRGEAWHMDTLDEKKLIAAANRIAGHRHESIRFGSHGSLVLLVDLVAPDARAEGVVSRRHQSDAQRLAQAHRSVDADRAGCHDGRDS